MTEERGHRLDRSSSSLRRGLREAGLSDQVIDAAWPSWWSDSAEADASGQAELRFALARKLGVSPRGLVGERVEFIWNDEARFKHLSTENSAQRAALTSFGMTIGQMLLRATPGGSVLDEMSAYILREALLVHQSYVDLDGLISFCWAVGIPVIHLRVFPLAAKSMHAMVVRVGERYAILLGRDASYPAPAAFTLAHELGHVFLRHLSEAPALVDLKDPATATDRDEQEAEADQYALLLLTGRHNPEITTGTGDFNAPTLAGAVVKAAPQYRVEPGTLALCVAYRSGAWARAMASLKFIYGKPNPTWRRINRIAATQLDWDHLGPENAEYLQNVMGSRD